MDAPCKIQGSIHVFRLVNNMCPGKWVHINVVGAFLLLKLNNCLYRLMRVNAWAFYYAQIQRRLKHDISRIVRKIGRNRGW